MNIDILLTRKNEAGLLATSTFDVAPIAAMLDLSNCHMTLELEDMDSLDLNVPLDEALAFSLRPLLSVQLGVVSGGRIHETLQLPFHIVNDPEEIHNMGHGMAPQSPSRLVVSFENFMKLAVKGQPVHRDDLGDENTIGSVLEGLSPAVLQLAPQLTRQRQLEAAPRTPGMDLGMGGPSPSGMGSGPANPQPRAPRKKDDG